MYSSHHSLEHLATLGFTTVEYILPPLCDVPAGPFLMGSDPTLDGAAEADEQPQHTVDVAAFQIARYPVTVVEYACFVRTGHPPPPDQKTGYWGATWKTMLLAEKGHPINQVSWYDAVAYADWLTRMSGQRWRLPTEAEWEKAARWDPRTGGVRIYPWGDAFETKRCNSEEANQQGNSAVDAYPTGVSPCGAWDMAGNVAEWTSSLYRPYPYVATDGREDAHAGGKRVLRGGNFWSDSQGVRAAFRGYGQPNIADEFSAYTGDELMGFRLVRAVDANLGLT
jgi:formylglycine-generating enzyme required for sulfatase activity